MRMGKDGFTLLEVVVVMGMLALLAALAYPLFQSWSRNAQYREAARGVASVLRDARANAISTNLQHQVRFEVSSGNYHLERGNRSAGTENDGWENASSVTFPASVRLRSGVGCDLNNDLAISFFPNGSASSTANLCILDTTGNQRFTIQVESQATGRVVIN